MACRAKTGSRARNVLWGEQLLHVLSQAPFCVGKRNLMSVEGNKTVVRRLFEEIYNSGNLPLADELLDARYVGYNPLPGQPPGVEGFKWAMLRLREAFPDFHVTIEDLIADEHKSVRQAHDVVVACLT